MSHPMGISFQCPHCGNPCYADQQYAGKSTRCAGCREVIAVPSRSSATIEFACPECGNTCHAPAALAGRSAKCTRCSAALVIPGPAPAPPLPNRPISPPPLSTVAALASSGAAAPVIDLEPLHRNPMRLTSGTLPTLLPGALVGAAIGAAVAFALRPSFFGEQLPFDAVITRGATLKGLDQILVPLAERSFNGIFAGALLGAMIGGFGAFILAATRKVETPASLSGR